MVRASSDVIGCRRPTSGVFVCMLQTRVTLTTFPIATPRERSSKFPQKGTYLCFLANKQNKLNHVNKNHLSMILQHYCVIFFNWTFSFSLMSLLRLIFCLLMSVCMNNIVVQHFIVHNMFLKILTKTGLLQHCWLSCCSVTGLVEQNTYDQASDEISEYYLFLAFFDNANVKVNAEHGTLIFIMVTIQMKLFNKTFSLRTFIDKWYEISVRLFSFFCSCCYCVLQ